ncbi:ATP-dependent zinc protease family protein [Agromyces litoreus]|uniref:ATP-dependent zinc protease family protein n=1 Tax=Agromyces litoreus TaxID=3158561 RepID=UPI003F5115C0
MTDVSTHSNTIAGWREWVRLPQADVEWIKAKLDTGARSSALHAFELEEFRRDDVDWVRFGIHPWQDVDADATVVELPVHDRRIVKSSTGHAQERLVVLMDLVLLGREVRAEVTLTNRDEMGFRMLVGREALRNGFLVDAGRSFLGGRAPRAIRRRNRGRD